MPSPCRSSPRAASAISITWSRASATAMPAPCWPPRSSISANIPCGSPRTIWPGPACRCGSIPDRLSPLGREDAKERSRNANGRNIHPQRPRKARPGARAGQRRRVLHAKAARPRRGALRQKARRGSGRGGHCGGRRGPRARHRRSRRRALPSSGRAPCPWHHTCRGRGGARRAYAAVGPRREGGAQERLGTMEQRTEQDVSPYRVFSRAEWATLRRDTPMTLEPAEVAPLRPMADRPHISGAVDIYLPLARLLSLYLAGTQNLFRAQQGFLATEDAKVPFIIG